MTLIDHPSPNHSPRKRGVRVDTIILHHTASPSDERGTRSAVGWLSKAGSKASAHYVIGHDGKVYRLVPENRTAWHAGESRFPWDTTPHMPKASLNPRSIGIELVNPGDGHTPFTEAQYRALGELLPDIVRRMAPAGHRWPVMTKAADGGFHYAPGDPSASAMPAQVYVLGHRDVAPGRKTDPADNFDWGRVREMLKERTS